MKNYKNNKTFFNYIISHKYEIEKDKNYNDIAYIKYDDKILKCKYLCLFTIKSDNSLMWSYENPYMDLKTQYITKLIKNNISSSNVFNYLNINKNDLLKIINFIIKNDFEIKYNDEIIYPLWILNNNFKEYNQYFLITEIIYF
jgi:hypothetical protein